MTQHTKPIIELGATDQYVDELESEIAQLRQDKAELVEVCKRGSSYIQCREGEEPSGLRLITAVEMFEAAIAKHGKES